jgi:L-ascorbate metabolism protein UlaG (beta-lactamase superfamily)
MKLTYIYHSGFAIEGENFTIIIDFFKDSDARTRGVVYNQLLKNQHTPLYVLASHAHPDHFGREILKWKQLHPHIIYVLSKDILDAGKATPEDAVFLDRLNEYQDNRLKIKAYGSTDIGISFLIEVSGKTVFHAGDLNNWHWNEESTPEESAASERLYLAELETLAGDYAQLDVAMFPVDKRLGKDYLRGAEQFVSRIKTGLFIPMHFGENYSAALAFKKYAEEIGHCRFAAWTFRGEEIEI